MTEKEPLNPEQPQYQIYQLQFPDIRFCLREGKEWKDCKIGISVKDQTCVFALDPNGGNDQQALKALFSALKSAELFLTKISSENAEELSRFSVNGQRLDAPQKGVNIVKMSDGSVKKVVVK